MLCGISCGRRMGLFFSMAFSGSILNFPPINTNMDPFLRVIWLLVVFP
jgi:hypothetical protein